MPTMPAKCASRNHIRENALKAWSQGMIFAGKAWLVTLPSAFETLSTIHAGLPESPVSSSITSNALREVRALTCSYGGNLPLALLRVTSVLPFMLPTISSLVNRARAWIWMDAARHTARHLVMSVRSYVPAEHTDI